MKTKYDIVIVGAGSGGIGAAVSAARLGADVLLIEKHNQIGGTATIGGVNTWEPGVGGTGLPFEIYKKLKEIPGAIGIYSMGRHICWGDRGLFIAGSECLIDSQLKYIDTLRRYGTKGLCEDKELVRELWHGVVFEPTKYIKVVERILKELGCTLLKSTAVINVHAEDGVVKNIRLNDGQTIQADYFIDCSGDGVLCEMAGCELMRGRESTSVFNEPHASAIASSDLNAVTLIYRITKGKKTEIEKRPIEIPDICWWVDDFPVAVFNQYPCGDWNINMLPTMEGVEFQKLGYEKAYEECRRRVYAHWRYWQGQLEEFQDYEISWIAPIAGIRESRRVIGQYILTENDLLQGITNQSHKDIIAIADHAMDTHGKNSSGCGELSKPYGIPLSCLIAKEFSNLLVASRCAGFSSIAASSCRLSRTIMTLGQATGATAALAKRNDISLAEIPYDKLRKELIKQHVQLEWPMNNELRKHLSS